MKLRLSDTYDYLPTPTADMIKAVRARAMSTSLGIFTYPPQHDYSLRFKSTPNSDEILILAPQEHRRSLYLTDFRAAYLKATGRTTLIVTEHVSFAHIQSSFVGTAEPLF